MYNLLHISQILLKRQKSTIKSIRTLGLIFKKPRLNNYEDEIGYFSKLGVKSGNFSILK